MSKTLRGEIEMIFASNEISGGLPDAAIEILQLIEATCLKVIGPDEIIQGQTIKGIGVNVPIEPYVRNQLRRVQRATLAQLLGKGE